MRTFFTQLEVYSKQGIAKDPWVAIIEDLQTLIMSKFHLAKDYLIKGIDANEDINSSSSTSILQMLSGLGLQDVLEFLNGKNRPPTISGSSQTIDHILVSQNVLEHLVGAGQLVKNSTFSDHPTLFIQQDDSILRTSIHSTPITPRNYTPKTMLQ